jgi:hypothetical protein
MVENAKYENAIITGEDPNYAQDRGDKFACVLLPTMSSMKKAYTIAEIYRRTF